MKDFIRRLSWKVELAIVLTLAFGWTLPSTLRALLSPVAVTHRTTPPISDIGVWTVILQELIILALLVPFLRTRGWTLARLGIQPSLKGCLQGFLLALTTYALYFLLAELVMSVWPAVASALYDTHLVRGGFAWSTVVVASTINPFYEEVFVCGYLISVLTEQRPGPVSPATAINASAGIRLSYHLYQGVAGVLSLVPTGLVFAIWFVRTRQLWPLIVAHAIVDFAAFAAYTG